MDTIRDIVIIGAGPSGSHLAQRVAKEGLDALLVEEHAKPGEEVVCSGIIGMEAFERFDLPGDAEVGLLERVRFISPSGKTLDFKPERPLAKIVSRELFDAALADRAVKRGAELWTSSRVEDVSVNPRYVEILVNREGSKVSVRSRLAVLATGYGSSLLRRAGFKNPKDLIQGAQTLLNGPPAGPARIFLGSRLAPGGFGWSVPLGETRTRVGVVTGKKGPHYLREILSRIQKDGDGFESGAVQSEISDFQVSPIPVGALDTAVSDRLMAVGEAAGQVKTTTQGGIYYGLLCADAAADTLAYAYKTGDLSRRGLASYNRRWRKRLDSELSMGILLRRFFSELSDRQIDRLFEIAGFEGVIPLIQKKARFDWHAPIIQSFLNNGFLGAIVRTALGLCPIKTKAL